MILTCPQCAVRFLLAASALEPDGRYVKCSECEEIWFQKPDGAEDGDSDEDIAARLRAPMRAEDIEMRPIRDLDDLESLDEFDTLGDVSADADSLYDEEYETADEDFGDEDLEADEDEGAEGEEDGEISVDDKDAPPEFASFLSEGIADISIPQRQEPRRAKIAGYAGALVVFFAIFGALLWGKSAILSAWPPSALLYQSIGFNVAVAGEGLVFDKIQAAAAEGFEGREMLTLKGEVINLTAVEQALPPVEAIIRDSNGEVIASWFVEIEGDAVAAEEILPFLSQYEAQTSQGHEVQMRFLLKL